VKARQLQLYHFPLRYGQPNVWIFFPSLPAAHRSTQCFGCRQWNNSAREIIRHLTDSRLSTKQMMHCFIARCEEGSRRRVPYQLLGASAAVVDELAGWHSFSTDVNMHVKGLRAIEGPFSFLPAWIQAPQIWLDSSCSLLLCECLTENRRNSENERRTIFNSC
jgi:hypothetical protein